MSKLATLELTGLSGNKYIFDVYSYESEFTQLGCVYVISKRSYTSSSNNFSHDIIYIGQTDNISNRLSNHHKKDCFDSNSPNCISIYIYESDAKRTNIENDLIKYYKPRCNDQLV